MWAFGQRMHKRREQIGMSQLDLAPHGDVLPGEVCLAWNGVRTEMTVSTALKIARALGVGIDYLAGTLAEEAEAAPAEGAPRARPLLGRAGAGATPASRAR